MTSISELHISISELHTSISELHMYANLKVSMIDHDNKNQTRTN